MAETETDRGYRLLVGLVIVFIAGYFCAVGIPELAGIGGKERYLAYHWFVFTYVPSREEVTYEADVLSASGTQPLLDPQFLLFDEWRNRPFYTQSIRRLGRALAEGSGPDVQRERAELEEFMHSPITYEVFEVRYDPIKRFLTHTALSRRSIGTFTIR